MQVFISYKREDEAFARQLSTNLRTWGYESWLDVEKLVPGESWDSGIDQGLRTSDVAIGVLTPESIASKNVLNEWAWAQENNIPLIPLKLRDVPSAKFPHRYIRVQYIDFTQNQEIGFEHLKSRLINPSTLYQPLSGNGYVTESPVINWDEEPKDNRGQMLKNVYDFWVKGVLDNVLRENKGFELELDIAPGAVLQHRDYGNYTLPNSTAIEQVFEDMSHYLLILGAPGAGKTILMLQLARQLLRQAKLDETLPIPVVFNLSSWTAKHDSLEKWVIEALIVNYSVPKKSAREWVEQEKLLLLLDGLDEVAKQYRDKCVEAINQFKRQRSMVRLTVCSRIADYEDLTTKLDLQGAVLLKPLNEAQIQSYLADDRLIGLRETMKSDAALNEMAQTPFLLNCMATSYQGKSEVSLRLPMGTKGIPQRRRHLFTAYLDYRFQRTGASVYAPADTRRYLIWLAKQMTTHQQSVFYIEGLQRDWLPDKPAQRKLELVAVLVAVLIGGLVGGLVGGLRGGLVFGLVAVLIGGLVGGLSAVLIGGNIDPVETLTIKIKSLVFGLLGGLAFGLLGALVFGLIFGLADGLGSGLVAGLFLGMGAALFLGLGAGIRVSENIQSRTQPNDGMRLSLWNGLLVGIVFGMLSAAIGLFVGGVKQGLCLPPPNQNTCGFEYFQWTLGWPNVVVALLFGLMAALAAGLSYGGRVVILHNTIRLLLSRRGSIPANYADFLDYAASLNILRKVGGGYIFIHRYLLEYFASLETPSAKSE